MKKLTISDLIKFGRASERSKYTFANKLKFGIQEEEKEVGGGNYWVRSESALSIAFKQKSTIPIIKKIEEIQELYHNPNLRKDTKLMYDRNLKILHNYEDIDVKEWYPSDEISILSKPKMVLLY